MRIVKWLLSLLYRWFPERMVRVTEGDVRESADMTEAPETEREAARLVAEKVMKRLKEKESGQTSPPTGN